MILSFSRPRTSLEQVEKTSLLSTTELHPFVSSKVASNIAHCFLRSLHPILDFSSLSSDSFIYTLLVKDRTINSTIISCLASLRRNSPLYFKEELNCMPIQAFFACSPKQYCLIPYNTNLTIPHLTTSSNTCFTDHDKCSASCSTGLIPPNKHSILRVKGVKRSLQKKVINASDFERTAQRLCTPKRLVQHSLIRKDRRIYLVSQTRRSLTRFCNKAYFDPRFSNKTSFFSFPLYMKSLLES